MTYGAVAPQLTDQANDIFPPHWYSPYWRPINFPQSDACQNLNIWTPNINDGKKRPVMVWLHGGGYTAGSAQVEDVYDGENLSRKGDVVVVSINHRLNSLGFLDLSAYDKKFSGNNGMLDIIAALRWIHENIAQFGGDPDNVTVFGQSGGGAKILTLTAMPAANGLFHKAIVQSGANELMGMSLPDKEVSARVAELTLQNLGIDASEVKNLQTLPYAELADAANKAMVQAGEEFGPERVYQGTFGWSPIVDGVNVMQDPVIGGFSDRANNIPLMIGTAANEWATMATSQTDNKNNWSDAEIERRLRQKYGDKTDAVKTARIKSDQDAPYIFTWETPIMGGFGMAYHCSEIPFVFNNIELSGEATGATMIFDNKSVVRYHHDDKLMNILEPGYND